ncbi:MAG: hypothetical protein IPK79_07185 [Vampirovibrionales bacterium]|nr:hypothetical protein [Vampirovibrionales bacterium]
MHKMLPDPVLLRLIVEAIRVASCEEGAAGVLTGELPTAASLARQFNLRLEKTKKLLRTLRMAGVVQPQGLSPKRYWFDAFACRQMTEDHPLYDALNPNDIWMEGESP